MRVFIKQLRLFNANNKLIELAIISYYQAFEQRNKWSRDGLLNPGELKSYDRKLIEKWQEELAFLEMQESLENEAELKRFSVKLYQVCQQKGIIPIRPDFVEE